MNKDIIAIEEKISQLIYVLRDQKVMLDADLAEMYKVSTKVLNQAVKRNPDRFPEDFMFQLSKDEWNILKSQIVTSRFIKTTSEWGGRRTLPYVFTEQGVAMLSSVLNSPLAIQVNISIMRVFVKTRQWAFNYNELARRIEELHVVQGEQGHHIAVIYKIIEELIKPKITERKSIGFKTRGDK